jgi:hypothetical protein
MMQSVRKALLTGSANLYLYFRTIIELCQHIMLTDAEKPPRAGKMPFKQEPFSDF